MNLAEKGGANLPQMDWVKRCGLYATEQQGKGVDIVAADCGNPRKHSFHQHGAGTGEGVEERVHRPDGRSDPDQIPADGADHHGGIIVQPVGVFVGIIGLEIPIILRKFPQLLNQLIVFGSWQGKGQLFECGGLKMILHGWDSPLIGQC